MENLNNNNKSINKSTIKPVIVYLDCEIDKSRVFSDNKGKAAVYRWVNKTNGKTYIGSSVDLTTRLYKYYSLRQLNYSKTTIHYALLKYGFSNFKLEILEYCEQGVNPVNREQYYIDLLKPEYNILNQAGSLLGFKHSEETLSYFREHRKVSEETRKNLSEAATGRILSPELRKELSEIRKGIKLTDETRSKIAQAAVKLRGVTVSIKDTETSLISNYSSLTEAAEALGVSRTAIRKSLDQGRPLKGKYIITS